MTDGTPESTPLVSTTKQSPRSLWWLVLLVAAIAVTADLVTKWWALGNLEEGQSRPLIGDFITLDLVFNPGAAFSLGESATWIFTVLTAIVLVALFWYAFKVDNPVIAVILGMLMGGAAGNLYDRLTQPPGFGRGHVVDFINYNDWFVGNVADIWIVCAAIALVLWMLLRSDADPSSSSKSERSVPEQQVTHSAPTPSDESEQNLLEAQDRDDA